MWNFLIPPFHLVHAIAPFHFYLLLFLLGVADSKFHIDENKFNDVSLIIWLFHIIYRSYMHYSSLKSHFDRLRSEHNPVDFFAKLHLISMYYEHHHCLIHVKYPNLRLKKYPNLISHNLTKNGGVSKNLRINHVFPTDMRGQEACPHM